MEQDEGGTAPVSEESRDLLLRGVAFHTLDDKSLHLADLAPDKDLVVVWLRHFG